MIVVLADDLSGAAELANVALEQGLNAEVQTVFDGACETAVCCVDMNTRLLGPAAAAGRAAMVTRQVLDRRPQWIFKKVDSVLRGHVLVETRAMLAVGGGKRARLVSANPSRQRIIRGGRYFIGGVPLDRTVFATDPEHPARSCVVSELLGIAAGEPADIETPDTTSRADVERHTRGLPSDTLPVGGADFFRALLQARVAVGPPPVPDGPPAKAPQTGARLLVCGSHAAWRGGRAGQCVRRGVPVFDLGDPPADIVQALATGGRAMIAIGDAAGVPGELLLRFMELAASVVAEAAPAEILIEGGTTARACLDRMNWTRLRAVRPLGAAVAWLRPWPGAGALLAIKPGSYEWPAAAWE